MSKIVEINRYGEKGCPPDSLSEVNLLANFGMEGDRHFGKARQLCFMSKEAADWMENQITKGLCFAKFKCNILLDATLNAKKDDHILVGEAVVTPCGASPASCASPASSASKACHDDCGLLKSELSCKLSDGVFFANVTEGGKIKTGDSVYVAAEE